MDRDLDHLRLLSIFHYVDAGLSALFGTCFGGIYMVIGITALVAPEQMKDERGNPMPPMFGWIFTIVGAAPLIIGLTLAFLALVVARSLQQRRRYTFCLVVAGVNCLFLPVGTVLGVFTIIVLIRPSVKALFDAGQPNVLTT